MLLSLRERFGNISTALIWSLGNQKVNCTMYRGKIDFQEHLALYYWVWNEIKAILLGHKLLPAAMGKVYKLYLGLMKTWCVCLYTHTCTHTCCFFPFVLFFFFCLWPVKSGLGFNRLSFSLNFHESPLWDILLPAINLSCRVPGLFPSAWKRKIIRHLSSFICHHPSFPPSNNLMLQKEIMEEGLSGEIVIALESQQH